MNVPVWTREQSEAINARNHTILVSAAAGSGKTAVLVERIVTLVREGFPLDRMLIVTFTRAAAAEMRQRLHERMMKEPKDDPVVSQALDDLDGAEISTIHSFCQKIIRNDFQAVDIDPLARICEEQQGTALFEQAFCDAMNALLEEDQPDFHDFADAFDQQEIREMTSRLYTFLMSLPEPFAWLQQRIEETDQEPLDEHPWYMTLVGHSARQLQGLTVLLQAQEKLLQEKDAVSALEATWKDDQDAVERLLSLDVGSPREMCEALSSFAFKRAASCRKLTEEQEEWKKRFTKIRNAMKALVKETADGLRLDEGKTAAELRRIKTHLKGLAALIQRTHEGFMAYKRQQCVVDFSDLEQMTLNILQQAEYRDRLQQDYDHIFVDECQDVSAVQDAILQAIHGEESCLFMVGDVKQSIYRFRLADPTLFLQRMRTYSDDPGARERRIFLQRNFRSRSSVLEATNLVFRKVMKSDVTEIDYLPEDELIPGRETEDDPPVEIHLLDTKSAEQEEDIEDLEAESRVVVERIRYLMTQTLEDRDGPRPYTYRDMVILLPKVARTGPALAELLQNQGVPVYYDGAESYFGLPEIRGVRALLSVLDNPYQDVALLSVLRMVPFCLTDRDLADIRLCAMGKDVPFYEAFRACSEQDTPLGSRCRDIQKTLEGWRFQAEVMRIRDFVWYIIKETGFYASCGALPEGDLRQANLRLLCTRAADYEGHGGTTLSGFLKELELQQGSGDSRSAKTLGEGENLVRIMTIHKSKGLEFPVVFCLRMSSKLHLPQKSGLKAHSRLGVCLPYVNRKLNIRRSTMGDEAFEVQRLLDEKAERARLLYVAMTRARERLILVGCAPKEGNLNWSMPEGSYRIWSAGSMMDWVMQVVRDQQSTNNPQATTPWKIRVWNQFYTQAVEKKMVIHNLSEWLEHVVAIPAAEPKGVAWKNTDELPAAKPMKTSVSSLVKKEVLHDPMPLNDQDEDAEEKRQSEEVIAPLRLSELPSKPSFMEERAITGAERGTATHRVLSLLPLEPLRSAAAIEHVIQEEAGRMVENGLLSQAELFVLDWKGIAAFYHSGIGQRMLQSGEVHREWSFNLRMPGENTLLQGVIDCAFLEDDQWILLDYKTDRIRDEEAFIQRYAMQMEWYARALSMITNRPVKERWLYALEKGKAYQVKESHETSAGA